ncbi:putative pollen-specific leucine-rich repeat extensin-like protein 2-like [Capsicum annuum]|nr:putative pollen-specific leucine-rich repeat extensin-like protein 2-like [Capsicum annuum]
MSIRFKFRSCQNFDSVDIDGRSSISLRELRLKIAHQKHLDTCQDFDLIFSDELSGEEYKDENFQIASGSSVIVKRVPARTMHSAAKVGKSMPLTLGLTFVRFQCQKRDPSGLNQVIQRGSNHSKIPTKLPEPKTPDAPALHKVISSDFPAVPNIDLPVELKCPLCNTVFKDAVMIPCCHHSFCEKCICLSLQENAMCPKCLCSRCRVEDLLPNLSLRKTIEHFLESQIDTSLSESDLRKYAPDGESGIQVKDISCAVTVVQREMEMPHSPSATGKGSNQVMAESLYDPYIRRKSLSRTMQQMDGGRDGSTNHWNFPSVPDYPEDCPGESKPLKLLHSHFQNEVDSSIKKNKGLWCDTRGGAMNFLPAGRVIKDRNCYMCGSPDHLIRDCAFASDPNPMLRTGNAMLSGGFPSYPSPYWNSNTYSTLRPFANVYGNGGNSPFSACMVPPTLFTTPYMRSMHAGMPLHGGIMRMGGMSLPSGNRDDLPLNQYEYMGLQLAEDKRRMQNEKLGRGQNCQPETTFKEHYPKNDREATGKLQKERELYSSDDSFVRKRHRKHLHVEKRREKSRHSSSGSRDKVSRHSEKSNDGFPSSSDRRRRESHQHHSRDSRKRHECDSTLDHYQVSDRKHGVDCHVRGSHQKHHPSSALELSSPVHQKARFKERGFGHDAKHSRHHARHSTDEVRGNRKRMSSGSYEDCRDGYYLKRKRVH